MLKAIVSDHTFPSLDLQRSVIEPAGFELCEIQPRCVTEDDVIARCGDADALLVQWAPITRRVMKSLTKVKGIVRYGVGVDNIDLDAARELRIGVANVPTYCLEEVSNHAMAMMLSLARRIPQDHASIVHGGWGVGPFLPIPAFLDMTLGLVSFGAIARRVARRLRPSAFTSWRRIHFWMTPSLRKMASSGLTWKHCLSRQISFRSTARLFPRPLISSAGRRLRP